MKDPIVVRFRMVNREYKGQREYSEFRIVCHGSPERPSPEVYMTSHNANLEPEDCLFYGALVEQRSRDGFGHDTWLPADDSSRDEIAKDVMAHLLWQIVQGELPLPLTSEIDVGVVRTTGFRPGNLPWKYFEYLCAS